MEAQMSKPTQEQLKQLHDLASEKCTELADTIQHALYEKALTMDGSYNWIADMQTVLRGLFPSDGDGSQNRVEEYFHMSEKRFVREIQFGMERERLMDHTYKIVAVDKNGETCEYYVVIGIDYDDSQKIHQIHDTSYRKDGIAYWLPEGADVGYDLDGEFTIQSIESSVWGF
jgi:hypothetical protein